jgi:hypothetical protein
MGCLHAVCAWGGMERCGAAETVVLDAPTRDIERSTVGCHYFCESGSSNAREGWKPINDSTLMRVEVLSFEGCPNAEATHDLVRQAMCLEELDAPIAFIEIDNPEVAQHMRFLGSPSVRVNGEDVEPSANDRTEYGLMCRTYSRSAGAGGTPPMDMIRAALRRGFTGK